LVALEDDLFELKVRVLSSANFMQEFVSGIVL
jgi:hypothetical protein